MTAVGMGTATISASLEGFKAECTVTVKGMEYGKIAITDLRPIDILPIVGQVNDSNGSYADERWYNSLDPLRIAEAYHIIEMMWTYGAGGYSPDEYKSLMDRLNVIMVNETPLVYDNYEVIRDLDNLWSLRPPSRHAYLEWFVLNSLLKHANFKIIFNPLENYKPSEPVFDHSLIREYSNNHPNSINILASSTGADYRYIRFRDRYENGDWFTEKNVLQFTAAPNREVHFEDDGSMTPSLNIVCQMDAELPNDTSAYEETASYTNGINDPIADKHNIVTIATCEAGDFDFTDYNVESTCFPIGFHDDVLFAGRQFPLTGGPEKPNLIVSSKGPWANSFCNYFNAAIASLCFQIKADMKDVDELLEMLRTTSLTDYVRQDGMTQRLHLMNPGGVIKKYLLPTNLPDAVGSDGSIELEKGYYKGVIFNVPGAEVRVNGEWIAFDNKNKEVILSHNPMNLEWRLNGDLLKRYGYTPGQTVEGQIMTVDDNWGGLRLEVPMTIKVR